MSPKKQLKETKSGSKIKRRNYDSAWKEVIEKLFQNFLEFFFPDFHEAIDFDKQFEFLNTGMRPVVAFSKRGDRASDVLVKVHLKNGTRRYICIFIHIEVQGRPAENFMEKMYIYNYRTFDKRIEPNVPVVSAAILTDEDPNYRPDEYAVKFGRFELRMKIPIAKIIDYKIHPGLNEYLNTTSNPMSLVVKAQLKSLEANKADDNTKFSAAKELIRECYKKGYSRDEVQTLVKFIEWVIRLPEDLENQLINEITMIEEDNKMAYLASWERRAMQKGMEEGIQKGKKEGMLEKAFDTAKKMLQKGFDLDTIIDITGLNKKQIEKLA